jgi:hypothetical protein
MPGDGSAVPSGASPRGACAVWVSPTGVNILARLGEIK